MPTEENCYDDFISFFDNVTEDAKDDFIYAFMINKDARCMYHKCEIDQKSITSIDEFINNQTSSIECNNTKYLFIRTLPNDNYKIHNFVECKPSDEKKAMVIIEFNTDLYFVAAFYDINKNTAQKHIFNYI